MLKRIRTHGVGPSPDTDVEFGDRLTIISGDNGLGKSLLLDLAWWSLTATWARGPILPGPRIDHATIEINYSETWPNTLSSEFIRQNSTWTKVLPLGGAWGTNNAVAIYAQAEGGFCVWDSNQISGRKNLPRVGDVEPGLRFDTDSLWHGLKIDGKLVCRGVIDDLVLWQKGKELEWDLFRRVLKGLSDDKQELELTDARRVSVDDARYYPCIRQYNMESVPLIHASSAIKRIVGLAYLITWARVENLETSRLLRESPANRMLVLIDEIEAHLHPRWQQRIVPALQETISRVAALVDLKRLQDSQQAGLPPGSAAVSVQTIITTHSPLIFAAVETIFNAELDRWIDIDLEHEDGGPQAVFINRDFHKMGDASAWLMSDAFDLASAGSLEAERAIHAAARLAEARQLDPRGVEDVEQQLSRALSETDPFWARWEMIKRNKTAA
jgi:hypothetical protein